MKKFKPMRDEIRKTLNRFIRRSSVTFSCLQLQFRDGNDEAEMFGAFGVHDVEFCFGNQRNRSM